MGMFSDLWKKSFHQLKVNMQFCALHFPGIISKLKRTNLKGYYIEVNLRPTENSIT